MFESIARLGLGGVPGEGFSERRIQVVAVGPATVVDTQLGEHVAVVVGVQDAFNDHVIPGVQGVAGNTVDQPDIRGSRPVTLAQHDAAQVVLTHQGQATAELLTQAGRDGQLARGAVAAQHNQSGFFGTHHHGIHAAGASDTTQGSITHGMSYSTPPAPWHGDAKSGPPPTWVRTVFGCGFSMWPGG